MRILHRFNVGFLRNYFLKTLHDAKVTGIYHPSRLYPCSPDAVVAPDFQGNKTMTFSTNSFAGFASLILAVLPLVVIAGSISTSF